jgi:hypothetical protein
MPILLEGVSGLVTVTATAPVSSVVNAVIPNGTSATKTSSTPQSTTLLTKFVDSYKELEAYKSVPILP